MYKFEPFKGEIQITHITGSKDGKTEIITVGKLVVKDGIEIPLKTAQDKVFIDVPSHEPIFINNREIIGVSEIRSDDVIQIDEDSALLRIRFKHSNKKSISEISSDAKVLAEENKGPTYLMYFYYLGKQMYKYSTYLFRFILTIITIVVLYLAYNQYAALQEETGKFEKRSIELDEKGRELTEKTDELDEKTEELDEKTAELDEELDSLLKKSMHNTSFSSVIDDYSNSVGYVDAETGFKKDGDWITYEELFDICEPSSDYDLYKDYYDELREYDLAYSFDLVWYGSGFLLEEDGTILTNRHIAGIADSLEEEFYYYGCDYETTNMSDYEFFARVVIIFPEDDTYYELRNIKYHEDYDFAIAQIDNFELGNKKTLKLSDDLSNNAVGSPIISLGYPSGIEFLVYKTSSSDTRSSELYDMVDSLGWADDRTPLFEYILDEKLINTHVTRGIVSQITHEAVSFDSSIYGGNSGGPILNEDGEVLGIVTWKWGENETFNLAVSSEVVLQEKGNLVSDIL